jgi:Na+(H+)/acetate symporter ActP
MGLERLLYLGAFLSVSAGLALLVSPTLAHRLRFREMDKEQWLYRSNRLTIAASVFVAVGIGLTVYLVVETIVGGIVASLIAAANAAWIAWFWFGWPLLQKTRGRR